MDTDVITPVASNKPWGVARWTHVGPIVEVMHASIRRGGYSSRHRHNRKFNDFYVLSGMLNISFYEIGTAVAPHNVVTLSPGQRLTVLPGVWHRFDALTDVELMETYWADVSPGEGDIERVDVGGSLDCQSGAPGCSGGGVG